jgi:hypothetical protein
LYQLNSSFGCRGTGPPVTGECADVNGLGAALPGCREDGCMVVEIEINDLDWIGISGHAPCVWGEFVDH